MAYSQSTAAKRNKDRRKADPEKFRRWDATKYQRNREKIRLRQKQRNDAPETKQKRREQLASSPLLQTKTSWSAMINRCHRTTSDNYKYYGGRGVTVCDRWRESFDNFLADMGLRPAGQSIDRIDNNGNYEPGNCKWATRSEHMRNRRPMPVKCECGACVTCRNRVATRLYRARKAVA